MLLQIVVDQISFWVASACSLFKDVQASSLAMEYQQRKMHEELLKKQAFGRRGLGALCFRCLEPKPGHCQQAEIQYGRIRQYSRFTG